MAIKPLNLESLHDLDGGRPAAAFLQRLTQAVRDCQDRPGDDRHRKVVMQVELWPVADHDEETQAVYLAGVKVAFQFKTTIPTQQTRDYTMAATHQGLLQFNEDELKNPRQRTLDGHAAVDGATEEDVHDVD